MTQPWEGRSVWCEGCQKGWVEIRESDSTEMELVVRKPGFNPVGLTMTREQAKTFAAQMMNLANRSRT